MRAALLLSFLGFVSLHNSLAQVDSYIKHWSRVYKYELRNLPKSALAVVDTIYLKAKADNNIPQVTKSLIYQSKFALSLEEDAELGIVNRFKKEISGSKSPLKNILESVLANIYWQHFKENRWRYYDRSQTTEKVNAADFRTWDSRQLFQEIHKHSQNALQNKGLLQKISLTSIEEILTQALDSKNYRPTLFDFLAHNALDFYETNESGSIQAAGHFKLNDARYFDEFDKVTLTEADSLAPLLQALKIYRSLFVFHKNDNDPTAYVNLELERLQFIKEQGQFDNSSVLYKNTLAKLKAKYENHPASKLIDFELASLLYKEGSLYNPKSNGENQYKKKEALQICEDAIKKFPNGSGAEKCRLLKENILIPRLELTTERFIPINKFSKLLVSYTNIDSLSFSAFLITKGYGEKFYQSMNDSVRLAALAKLKAEANWKVRLIKILDYQAHTTEVVVPQLKQGEYLLVARVLNKESKAAPIFAFAKLQCTNLALIETTLDDKQRYQVVDRNNGHPIAGADIHFKSSYPNSSQTIIDQHSTTDKDGFAELKRGKSYSSGIEATVIHVADTATVGNFYVQQSYAEKDNEMEDFDAKTFLFSDRSIYRPGQTVYFKGILIKTKGKKSTVVPGEYVEVIIEDVNNNEVEKLRLKTNSYGSFSGEFKLPSSGLTGEYSLYADEDTDGDTRFYDRVNNFQYDELSISVEEYKRPTFETSFNPDKETFKLNDTISLTGNAIAYNGSKIGNAKISYRVKRNVRYPDWYYWYYSRNTSNEEEITEGEGKTNNEGEFKINFAAIPDEKVSKESRPIFQYEVTVDVTDINGETRSATTHVKVGYHSLLVTIHAANEVDKKIQEYAVNVSAENLNGQTAHAKGTVQLYKLKFPSSPVRKRTWEEPDSPLLTKEEFNAFFPNDSYNDEDDPTKRNKGNKVAETTFNTEVSKEMKFKIDKSWPLGGYLIELTSADDAGNNITEMHQFQLLDANSKKIGDNELLVFQLDKPSYKVGDVAKLKVGSASSDITLTIDIEKNHKVTKTYVESFSGNFKEISIPITENMGEGFGVNCSGVNYNSFLQTNKTVPIISIKDKIEIETITFKDKLQPGAKQLWSFEIKGNDATKKEAEVLASMYDASLDQFKPHEWTFNPIPQNHYYSYHRSSANESFGNQNFTVRSKTYGFNSIPKQYYDQLDWFGFAISGNSYINRKYLERLYSDGYDVDNPSKISLRSNKNLKKGFVYGAIKASDGSAMPGVNIVIKGTAVGTVTDADGNYSIEADKGDTLVYSFIGYSTAEAKVTKKNVIDVTMNEDVTQLSEVVVTGYGVPIQKKSLSFAVSSIVQTDSLNQDFVLSQLEGRVAGVQITGMPGGPAKITIRGNATINGNQEPLYVVDGVIVASSKIDQNDLASIQVLQNDAAVALYGSRASNGVVILTTKSGQKKLDEELAKVSVRKDFKETAFFFPHLNTNEEGRIQFSFTTPEALTRWKLQLLAHTKDLLTATKTLQTVTQKELMVTPNPPRFLRVGDEIIFSTKISNLSGESKSGNVTLQLTNAVSGISADNLLGNINRNQPFKVGAKGNTQIAWKLKIPEGIDAIQYKVVAKAGNFSDGEQNALPILSNRILVTETMPMQVRAGETKTFTLEKLKATISPTIQQHQLTLEITSNPAWYAIQALPYLMEFPHECAEQTFARYYANVLASHIANSNPKIKKVFDQWASSNSLISNLENNAELKSIIIQETPWLRDAQSEAERKKRIALLFDLGKMKDQLQIATDKLQKMQMENGGFPWFSGSNSASRYITLHIAAGLGHLKKLQISSSKEFTDMLQKAITYLDLETNQDYDRLLNQANAIRGRASNEKEGNQQASEFMERQHVGKEQIQYLYMRSFFPDLKPTEKTTAALQYYVKQSKSYWQEFNLYDKAMIALSQFRDNNSELANEIMKSLAENSIRSEEMGMYWKENKAGWNWNEAPIETQALLIEAFSEILSPNKSQSENEKQKTVDDLRLWLLKNKQTSQWKTTKATTEAIYALLLNGTDWLPLEDQVECSMGGKRISTNTQQSQAEAGTGYFKIAWKKEEIKPSMSEISLTKKGTGVAWGGLYWQYFEDLDKITSAETPLKLSKKVFLVNRTAKGELLTEIKADKSLEVGNLIRIRIELSTDRYLEFLHMKDMRASGLEPVDVLSEYKWKDGLGYYQSTKDASTNFFFDSIDKGIYVFEYDLRVNNEGNFSNGITTIQSMYAPEFSSHSEGIRISVK
jgi:TonB-dependent SusC/RagA subfamily outer membrane receptor